jgi:hypothetical protein
MRQGDVICIFLGLRIPIVLRAAESGHFRVVGCCYAHGIEDGAALFNTLPDG